MIKWYHKNYSINPKKGRKGEKGKNSWNKQKTNCKVVDLKPTVSVITLNVNGENTTFKDSDCQIG